MPLYQQGGLLGSRSDLSSIPQAIMGYIRAKQIRDQQQNAEQRLDIDKFGDILGMASTDPNVMQAPETEKLRQGLGYPQMTMPQRQGLSDILKQYGEGIEPTVTLDEYNRPKSTTIKHKTPTSLRTVNIGEKTGVFDPVTGKITPTEHPSSRVASTNINLNPAAPSERENIAKGRASIDTLDNLKQLFDKKQTKTGPVSGRITPTAGLLGLTSDEQESFMAATSAFKNQIIKEITGAQMSEAEASRILKQVPDITDPPARWKAKWQQSKLNLEMLQKRRLEILKQSGLKVPGGAVEDISSMSEAELERIARGG